MRHASIHSKLRQTFGLALSGLFLFSPIAHATPVYLNTESRFPSGHHPRNWLENRTSKIQLQRWFRVEMRDKAFGWAAEDHLLTPLKLAKEAELIAPVPARRDSQLDAVKNFVLTAGTRVLINETQGSWVRATVLNTGKESWIPSENLRAVRNGKYDRAFIPSAVDLRVLPGAHARKQARLQAGTFVQIVSQGKTSGWLEVKARAGFGYVQTSEIVTLDNLHDREVRPLFELMPLRSAPLPYADLKRTLAPSANLKVASSETLRWGQAKVPSVGHVWYPITEDNDEVADGLARETITTNELFKRKIFDMASSPALPSLKIASAGGVFRTTDGNKWTKLPRFENQNYPIAMSGRGTVFIGPLVSADLGETFEQWIRWDALVATLRQTAGHTPKQLQIQEIRPEDPSGNRVMIKINIGNGETFRLLTEDQGRSWRHKRL